MKNGFAKIRTGVLEHLLSGRIGFLEFGVYATIHLQADYRTGIWIGSAPRLLATAPRGATLRIVQRAVERCVEIDFLRTFHIAGVRGNYRVLIHKYEPVFGALKGTRLNAIKSQSWRTPIYEPVADSDADDDADDDADVTPFQELDLDKNKRKTKTLPRSREAADPRHRPFFTFAISAYSSKFGEKPNWNGREAKRLGDLLAALPDITTNELQRRFFFYLESTDEFVSRDGHGMLRFCEKFNALRGGPLRKGGGNGKLSGTDLDTETFKQFETA